MINPDIFHAKKAIQFLHHYGYEVSKDGKTISRDENNKEIRDEK